MIGIVAKLAKAAKLAQTAEAAIDIASNKLAPGEKPGKPGGMEGAPVDEVPAGYRALLDAGTPDPRDLLGAAEAARIVGKPIRKTSLAGRDGVLSCDYRCDDRADTTLGVHVEATRPWEYFDSEIAKKEIFQSVGDAAFRGGRQIYVKAGERVFWIHTAGEVMVEMAVEAATIVAKRLEPEGADPAQ